MRRSYLRCEGEFQKGRFADQSDALVLAILQKISDCKAKDFPVVRGPTLLSQLGYLTRHRDALHPGSPVSSVNLGDQPVGFTGSDCADMPPLLGRRIFPTFPKPSLNARSARSAKMLERFNCVGALGQEREGIEIEPFQTRFFQWRGSRLL
jgi:hypothetical protein